MPTQELFRETPIFTQLAFARLLEWLDDGVDSHGARYLEMRRRLVDYFDRRNRPAADELADETLNSVGRQLEQSGVILTRPPARYCYVIARFVLLEDIRRVRRHVSFDEPLIRGDAARSRQIEISPPEDGVSVRERRLDCLDRCLETLKPAQREAIVEYHREERRPRIERRRELATRLGITMNALGIRMCRIRNALMTCVRACHDGHRRI